MLRCIKALKTEMLQKEITMPYLKFVTTDITGTTLMYICYMAASIFPKPISQEYTELWRTLTNLVIETGEKNLTMLYELISRIIDHDKNIAKYIWLAITTSFSKKIYKTENDLDTVYS